MDTNCRLCRCEEVAAKVIDGEAIIINLNTGVYYSLDKVGGSIWEMLERGHSLDEIIGAVTAQYDVSQKQARADVDRLASELVQENLVKISNDEPAPLQYREAEQRQKLTYESPGLNIYRDMGDLLALDPPTPGFQNVAWRDPDDGESL